MLENSLTALATRAGRYGLFPIDDEALCLVSAMDYYSIPILHCKSETLKRFQMTIHAVQSVFVRPVKDAFEMDSMLHINIAPMCISTIFR